MTLVWRCDDCGAEKEGDAHPVGWRVHIGHKDKLMQQSILRHRCSRCAEQASVRTEWRQPNAAKIAATLPRRRRRGERAEPEQLDLRAKT